MSTLCMTQCYPPLWKILATPMDRYVRPRREQFFSRLIINRVSRDFGHKYGFQRLSGYIFLEATLSWLYFWLGHNRAGKIEDLGHK